MKLLMITWTDVFYSLGDFFNWCFKGMRALGQLPNLFLGGFVIFLLAYWCVKIVQQTKRAERDGTYK